jgi:hypothetical protein
MSFLKKNTKKKDKKNSKLKEEESLSPKEKLSPKILKKQEFEKLPNPLDELTDGKIVNSF